MRQAEAADDPVACVRKARFGRDAAVRLEQLVGHAIRLEYRNIAGPGVEMLSRTEKLERAEGALIIVEREFPAPPPQPVAAELGEAHPPALVKRLSTSGEAVSADRRGRQKGVRPGK